MEKKAKAKIGEVLKRSGDKSVVVIIERLVKHSLFKKYIKRRKKFHVHDENNSAQVGDRVRIVEGRPISKTKSWKLDSVLEKAD